MCLSSKARTSNKQRKTRTNNKQRKWEPTTNNAKQEPTTDLDPQKEPGGMNDRQSLNSVVNTGKPQPMLDYMYSVV